MCVNLVPYPRLHFTYYQMSPLCSPEDLIFDNFSAEELIQQVNYESNSFVKVVRQKQKTKKWFWDFDRKTDNEVFRSEGLTAAALHIYRGDFKTADLLNTG